LQFYAEEKADFKEKPKTTVVIFHQIKRMILHEDISNPIIIPSLNFPIQLMVFFCLPAHHFSATNKNNLHYGRCTNTNRNYWFLETSHQNYKSVREY